MIERIKQRLGKLGKVGVGTTLAGTAIGIILGVLPYTGYNISQFLARVLLWVSIGIGSFGIVLIVIALVRNKQKEEKTQIGNLGNVVVSILRKIHKRDLKLENSAEKQYLALFSLKDFKELWENYGIMQNGDAYESIIKEVGMEKLKKDKIQRQKQIDDLQQRLNAITKQEEWTLEGVTKLASFVEQFPKTQNGAYQGIGKRRETDRKWQALFLSLNNLRLEYAQVFADKNLAQMIKEYFDHSKVAATIIMLIALMEEFVPSDFAPTEYLVSGIEDAKVKISNHMTELLEAISKKTTELEREQHKADTIENHHEL